MTPTAYILNETNMTLTKNEIITLQHLADGDQHDEKPLWLTNSQFIAALKSLKEKGMVRAFVNYGEVISSEITELGLAALDDMMEEELSEGQPLFTKEEMAVLTLLGDECGHSKGPEGMMTYQFKQVCRLLERKELVDICDAKDGWVASITEDGLDALEFIREEKKKQLTPLQATLLDLLCNNAVISNIQTFSPFNMYSVEELYNEFLPLKEMKMINFFSDKSGGPRSLTHMKIMDEGRIALRKYKEKHPEAKAIQHSPISNEEDQKLIDDLEKYCDTRETAEQLVSTLRKLTTDPQITDLINAMVDSGRIREGFVKCDLYKILHDADIYKAGEGNWRKHVKNYK